MKRSKAPCFLFLLFGIGNLAAQTAVRNPDESRDAMLRQLVARVESLEAEVRQLRAEKSPRRIDSSKEMAPLMDSASLVENETTKTDENGTQEGLPRLKLRGFGDVDYHWADRGPDRNAFRLGQLDLFLTSQLAENVNVLSENVIEADVEDHFGFEIERLLLQWTPRDYFNIALGRYHTAIGYYSNAYHHGKWLQTAIGRPSIFAFEDEDGLLPIHNVGLSVSGAIPSATLGLHYLAEIGNGRNYNPGEEPVQNLSDNNDFKAINLALFARPDRLPGLQIGGSVYFDRLAIGLLPAADQTIAAAYAVYVSPAFEWLNEGVWIHDASSLGTFETRAFYTQVARQFGKFRPYARYQLLDASEGDPIVQFSGKPGLQQTVSLGVRYDFTDFAAIKLQGDHSFGDHEDGARKELTLQMSFTF